MFKKEILKSRLYVICETEAQAKELLKWGHEQNHRWSSGISFLNNTMFNYKATAYCIYDGYIINADDLNLEVEEAISFDEALIRQECKYKQLKVISAKTIFQYNPCTTEFANFIRQYDYIEIEWTIEIEDKFEEENGWIEFLVDKGFIKKRIIIDENLKAIKKLQSEIEEKQEKIKKLCEKMGTKLIKDKSWMCLTSNTESVVEWDKRPNTFTIVDYVNVKNELIGDISKEEYKYLEKFCYYDVELKCADTGKHYYGFSYQLK